MSAQTDAAVRPFYLSGTPTWGAAAVEVVSPWDGSLVARVSTPDCEQLDKALSDLAGAREAGRRMSAHQRAAVLRHVAQRLDERAHEFACLVTAESGKPLKWSRVEVHRAAAVFEWAAEEARRFSGELQRLDTTDESTGRLALIRRFPRGPVLGIAPFNFPLNLVAHKVAPAIAVGAPILLKPAPATPLSALALAEIVAETDLPAGMLSVLPVANEAMPGLVQDPRLPVVSFTGSEGVGQLIQSNAPHKHVTLELGGNAAVIVDRSWIDLDAAARRVALFGNYQAGQSCIAVQRVLVHTAVYDPFVRALTDAVRDLHTGDPTDERTEVGPVINDAAAERISTWVAEAVAAGAELLTGGERCERTIAPTVLARVPPEALLAQEEVFGPVLTVSRFDTIEDAFTAVNASRYGLQAGVFTTEIDVAFRAHRELEVGGVIIGDVPTFRADQMPYGGWKASGVGREGIHAAMDDFTAERVLVLSGVAV